MTIIDDVSRSRKSTNTKERRAKQLAWYEEVRKSSPIHAVRIDFGPRDKLMAWLDLGKAK